MNNLLQTVIDSAGGLKKWNSYDNLNAELKITGTLFDEKGYAELVKNVSFCAGLHNKEAGFNDFPLKHQYTSVQNQVITINNHAGMVLQSSTNFQNFLEQPVYDNSWNILQMLYFGSASLWTAMTFPFNLVQPGVDTEEINPLILGKETLRHLMVTFPEHITSPNKIMSFFFSPDGLLARADYEPEIFEFIPVTQILSDYKEFQGIKFAAKRKIYPRNADGSYNLQKELIAIEIKSLHLETAN